MIVNNLHKIYKTKDKKGFEALKGLSFTLPEKGLIFFVGKSGSGKTTLLNVLGGIDEFNEGDVIVHGHNLANFDNAEYEKYRSSYVSFIFQDYYLLEELSVKDNIKLIADYDITDQRIAEILGELDLTGFEDRMPVSLSGGQAQRVSIARAIAKDPDLILCDEPTGNLDNKTSKLILDVLKKISKDKLVIVVSHDMILSYKYADIIIEISEGKIISKKVKDPNYINQLEIKDDVIYLPFKEELKENDIKEVNEVVKSNNLKEIIQKDGGFKEDLLLDEKETEKPLELQRITSDHTKKLFKKFLLSHPRSTIISSLIIAILIALFTIIQSFIHFDPVDAATEAGQIFEGVNNLNYATSYKIQAFDQRTIDKFDELGDVYYLYNFSFSADFGSSTNNYEIFRMQTSENNLNEFYAKDSPGTLFCDLDFLTNIYGVDGKLEVLAGDIESTNNSHKVIITDYLADSMLYYRAKRANPYITSYEDLVTKTYMRNPNYEIGEIGAIINTNYKERYQEIFDLFQSYLKKEITYKKLQKTITDNEIYLHFVDEINNYLNISYSFADKDWFLSTLNTDIRDYFRLIDFTILTSRGEEELVTSNYVVTKINALRFDLNDYEFYIPYVLYNSLFGTSYYAKELTPMDGLETITIYRYFDSGQKKRGEAITLKVAGLTNATIVMGKKLMEEFQQKYVYAPISIYMTNVSRNEKLLDLMHQEGVSYNTIYGQRTNTITRYVDMFHDLFVFIMIFLLIGLLIYITLFGINSIKKHRYQIGVLKAVGGADREIRTIFVIRTVVISLFTGVVGFILSIIGLISANKILLNSIKEIIGKDFLNITIIAVRIPLLLLDLGILIVIIIISSLINTLYMRLIKPINIIKAKE